MTQHFSETNIVYVSSPQPFFFHSWHELSDVVLEKETDDKTQASKKCVPFVIRWIALNFHILSCFLSQDYFQIQIPEGKCNVLWPSNGLGLNNSKKEYKAHCVNCYCRSIQLFQKKTCSRVYTWPSHLYVCVSILQYKERREGEQILPIFLSAVRQEEDEWTRKEDERWRTLILSDL